MREIPSRITPDAILEAIIDIRFASESLPEVMMGKLLCASAFTAFTTSRLPQADIPFSAREADPNLRYQPVYQLEGEGEIIRLGTNMLSLHVLQPYPGWEVFRSRAKEILGEGLSLCGETKIERCALRYVNVLNDEHGVSSLDDLNLNVAIRGQKLVDVTVSFLAEDKDASQALIRVASSKHVRGDLPENTVAVVDVEVKTTAELNDWDFNRIMLWLDDAHEFEKKHFFSLLPDSIINNLRSE